ncbi:MAG: hypothetical protein JW715_09195 [Sedimentisphaerales bacterium]|nr:hypothetical protein [Sedimentisphaerales bacterium]
MSIKFNLREFGTPEAGEIYITAVPANAASNQQLWHEMFAGIREAVVSTGAFIFQERIFISGKETQSVNRIRQQAYGDIDDGVAPSLLLGKTGLWGSISGVQVYAVKCKELPHVIDFHGNRCGRIAIVPGGKYLALSALSAPNVKEPAEQSRNVLTKAVAILDQHGANFSNVPRTWMWLGDILSWYDMFNRIRNEFFTEQGIIDKNISESLPASTGIGLLPANGGACSMDLTAVIEPSDSIKYLPETVKQQCAFEYGSAFSRATEVITPAGRTIYVSGTASIDISGITTNIGNPIGQIEETIENVRAVLRDTNCSDGDIVQVVAYCKTAEIEKMFLDMKSIPSWPWLTTVCDICRPDLLFEIEAVALVEK